MKMATLAVGDRICLAAGDRLRMKIRKQEMLLVSSNYPDVVVSMAVPRKEVDRLSKMLHQRMKVNDLQVSIPEVGKDLVIRFPSDVLSMFTIHWAGGVTTITASAPVTIARV